MGVKVCGPEGCLIKSRVQANPAVAGDWSSYTIYLMMPGDWTSARVFCWIYDVADIKLEADGTSSLITLTMNANSPTLTSDWTKFFIGFDNIAEHRNSSVSPNLALVRAMATKITIKPSSSQPLAMKTTRPCLLPVANNLFVQN